MGPPLITLTTDFGTEDAYVGVMKGVILGINPRASIVDITHQVQPQSIGDGAFIIGSNHRYFPRGTLHIIVVDPGVGTPRDAVLLVSHSAMFLAPDNGVLSYVLREGFHEAPGGSEESPAPHVTADGVAVGLPQSYSAYRLTNSDYWLHPVSSTFHGRDIFAPVAAHISLGVPLDRLGQRVNRLACLPQKQPHWDGETLVGHIVYIDRFGNLITNIPAYLLPPERKVEVEVLGQRIVGLSDNYEERTSQEGTGLLAIIGSYGNLEVSVRNGSAAHELEAATDDPVWVETYLLKPEAN